MPLIFASFACGLIFGAGLLISGMNQPDKVLGFLDLFGAWDATLAFVMAGAVAVASIGFALARRRGAPVLAPKYLWPERSDIDAPLVTGAVLFGIGWGLVGLCPGPALVNLAGVSQPILIFVAAMALGMLGYEAISHAGLDARQDGESWYHLTSGRMSPSNGVRFAAESGDLLGSGARFQGLTYRPVEESVYIPRCPPSKPYQLGRDPRETVPGPHSGVGGGT